MIASIPVYTTQWSSSYIFYLNRKFNSTDTALKNIQAKTFLVYLSDEEEKKFQQQGKEIRVVKRIDNYPITRMNIKFINKMTRDKTWAKMDIVLISTN